MKLLLESRLLVVVPLIISMLMAMNPLVGVEFGDSEEKTGYRSPATNGVESAGTRRPMVRAASRREPVTWGLAERLIRLSYVVMLECPLEAPAVPSPQSAVS